MAIINLRKHYYPLYTKDTFIEVPDEVAAVMEECRLYENRQEGRKSYYHVYSMDCSPGIENHAMFLVQSPEDLIIQEIDDAAEELLLERLAEAITHLSIPTTAGKTASKMAPRPISRCVLARCSSLRFRFRLSYPDNSTEPGQICCGRCRLSER